MTDYSFNMTGLPDPTDAGLGTSRTATLMPAMQNAINLAHAHCTGPLVAQEWPDDDFLVNFGDGVSLDHACEWRVPCMGTAFDSYTIVMVGKTSDAAGATVKFSNDDGDNVSHTFVSGGGGQPAAGALTTITLTLPASGSGNLAHDTITMETTAKANPSTTCTIRSVDIYTAALTSPLTAGVYGTPTGLHSRDSSAPDLYPMGGTTMADGYALSAALGKHMIDAITAVDQRAKGVVCWSAWDNANGYVMTTEHSGGGVQACALPAARLVRNSTYRNPLDKLTIWVKARNTSSDDGFAVFCCQTPGRTFGSMADSLGTYKTITIPAGTNQATWFSATINVYTTQGFGQSVHKHFLAGLLPYPGEHVFHHGQPPDGAIPEIVAWSMWGDI